MLKISELKETEYNLYYKNYLDKVSKRLSLIEGFKKGERSVISFFESIPEEKLNYRYLPDKWSIKEVFQHIIDTERVFIYRCFRIARQDKTQLSGFEQNDYIKPSNADKKTIQTLINEYNMVRQSSISLLESLNNKDLEFIGNANGSNMSARAAAFTILGHEIWHMDIIKERYL